ncbi:MAG TPA: phage protein GemA/Gp16 family protein [Rhizomicrobium sp.]|jgi:phage gp16-like protein
MGSRNEKLRKLHAAARQLGLDDEGYRARLFREAGKRSARDLDDAGLDRALAGFHVKHSGMFHSHLLKAKALWIACWNLGALDHGDDSALDSFVKRQTGKDRLQFLTPSEANSVSEALKAIAERHGFAVPVGDRGGLEARRRLLLAQWKRMHDLGVVVRSVGQVDGEAANLDRYIGTIWPAARGGIAGLTAQQLDALARNLGARIRRARVNGSAQAGAA